MLEDVGLSAYRSFYDAVPAMADCLRRSERIRILDFAGNATIGSHDATFASWLKDPLRKRLYRILLLSPLSIEAMTDRGKSTGHTPQEYVSRILGTLEHLRSYRCRGSIDVGVRLYRRDPNWYSWIFDDCAFVDSHALGVGRLSPRFQFSGPRPKAPPDVFEALFENAWGDPGNLEVDFGRFDVQVAALRREAEARIEGIARGREPEPGSDPGSDPGSEASIATGPDGRLTAVQESDPILPSVWNVRAETYASPAHALSQLRTEMERSPEFLYFGATGESRFGTRNADFSSGLSSGAGRTKAIRISLISGTSAPAIDAKLRVSLRGRTRDETREAIHRTWKVLEDLRAEHNLDLETRFRKELGATRAYVFDDGLCLSPFQPLHMTPPPYIYFRERGQRCIVDFFKRHFVESWEQASPETGDPTPESVSPPGDGRPAVFFDTQKYLLTIDGEPVRLPRAVIFFLVAVAYERRGCLPLDQDIDGRPARRRRTELGVRLGHQLAREVIETVPGLGYRFQPWVKVVGTGQV